MPWSVKRDEMQSVFPREIELTVHHLLNSILLILIAETHIDYHLMMISRPQNKRKGKEGNRIINALTSVLNPPPDSPSLYPSHKHNATARRQLSANFHLLSSLSYLNALKLPNQHKSWTRKLATKWIQQVDSSPRYAIIITASISHHTHGSHLPRAVHKHTAQCHTHQPFEYYKP